MPIDHPWRVKNVYAMEAIVVLAIFLIDSARGGSEECDFKEVMRYGAGSEQLLGSLFESLVVFVLQSSRASLDDGFVRPTELYC